MALKKIGYSKYLIPAVGYGASLAAFLAIVWIIVTCIGLAVYHECPSSYLTSNTSIPGYFTVLLKQQYYTDASCFNPPLDQSNLMVTSFELMIWNSVYLAFSTFWLLASITAILKVNNWDDIDTTYLYAIPWIVMTLIISIFDVILGSFFAKDLHYYHYVRPEVLLVNLSMADVQVLMQIIMTGIMMTIVYKGYILWLANLTFSVYALYAIMDIKRAIDDEKNSHIKHNTLSRGPISAYENSIEARSARWLSGDAHSNRPHLYSSSKPPSMYSHADSYQGEVNRGYVGSSGNNNNYNNNSQRLPQAYDTGSDRKPMPWDKDAPSTPKPDYSPQPIRAMRSALKPVPPTRSNNYMR